MISTAVITGLGTFALTALIKIWAAKSQAQAKAMETAIKGYREEAEERKSIRESTNKGFAFTRRILALSVIGAVVVVPLLAPLLTPFVPVSMCTQAGAETQVFWGLFSYDNSALACTNSTAVQVMPFHVDMAMMVLGFYFGSKVK